jgi:hypothetical protein
MKISWTLLSKSKPRRRLTWITMLE